MPLLLLFLLVPILELWLLIRIGGLIGAWPTVAWVIGAAMVGTFLVRIQGFAVLQRARAAMAAGEFPATSLLDGLFLLLAGLLLILPGFLTDIIGLLLFVPPFRRWLGAALWEWLSHRPDITIFGTGRGRVIEGEFHEVDPKGGTTAPVLTPPTDRRDPHDHR
jgi:UPF0716 protein FxsA